MVNTNVFEDRGVIAIVGGGPAGLFLLKSLMEENLQHLSIHVFEKGDRLGMGMPYGPQGALKEHITNVSGDEIPLFKESLFNWVQNRSTDYLHHFNIQRDAFHDKEPVPRLLFGHYLSDQFTLLLEEAMNKNNQIYLHANTQVKDIRQSPDKQQVEIVDEEGDVVLADYVVICTGHIWPKKLEGKVLDYFDSPYPPQKLQMRANHPVAIKGSSLTAVDAIRTLARANGDFSQDKNGKLTFHLSQSSPAFSIHLHALGGLLPAVRIHLEDPRLGKGKILEEAEIRSLRAKNEGFLPLDEVYSRAFLLPLKEQDPAFYGVIRNLTMEDFVEKMLTYREGQDPFILMEKELSQAEISFEKEESVPWKEMLSVLSFTMNYPAKYFSAEDMLRLQRVLKPLISVVIAFLPQSSAFELIALKEAGVLSLKDVDKNSEIIPQPGGGIIYRYSSQEEQFFPMYVDCTGQLPMQIEDFPYRSLKDSGAIKQARLAFRNLQQAEKESEQGNDDVYFEKGKAYLNVAGLAINDHFQLLNLYGEHSKCLYIMAVPYIGGYNPDYSGLDFCEEAGGRIAKSIKLALLARCL